MSNIFGRITLLLRKIVSDFYVTKRSAARTLFLGVIGYILLNSFVGFVKNELFLSTAWDLGLFNQAFESTLRGTGFFTYSIEPYTNPGGSFFGVHFSPVLVAIMPFYAAYPSINTLLIVQAFALGIGAIPLYRLSLLVLKRVGTSLAIAFSYLLYFPLQMANLFDFHVEAFIVAPLLFSIFYLYTRRWRKFAVAIIIALSTLEYASFLVIALGLAYLLLNLNEAWDSLRTGRFQDARILVPVVLTIVASVWFVLARAAMSSFNPSAPLAFEGASNWSVLGAATIAQIPLTVLLNPVNAFRALAFDFTLKLAYLAILLAPLLFLPVFRPRALVTALPWIGFAFLSNYQAYYQFGNQYTFLVAPGLFWALVLGVQRFQSMPVTNRLAHFARHLPKLLVFSSVVCFVIFASFTYPVILAASTPHVDYLDQTIQLVPEGSIILTQNNIFPHFDPGKFSVYAIPIMIPAWTPYYGAMVNLTFSKHPDYVLVDGRTDPLSTSVAIQWLQTNGGYGVKFSVDGIILYKKF